MSDHAAESMKFKVVQMNKDGQAGESRDFRIITLDRIFAWIDKKDYDEAVKDELKKMVSKYPQNAYVNFGKNFQKHLGTAQKNARKNRPLFTGELGDDNYKKINSLDDQMAPPEKKGTSKGLPSVATTQNDFDDMEPPVKKPEAALVVDQVEEINTPVVSPSKKRPLAHEIESVEKFGQDTLNDALLAKEETELPYGMREINDDLN